jgi:hypothetical protein
MYLCVSGGEVSGRVSVCQWRRSERPCVCVLVVSIWPFFYDFSTGFLNCEILWFFLFFNFYCLFYTVPEFIILKRLLPSVTSIVFSHFSIVNNFLDVERRTHDAVYHQDYNGGTDICGILMIYYLLISGYIFPDIKHVTLLTVFTICTSIFSKTVVAILPFLKRNVKRCNFIIVNLLSSDLLQSEKNEIFNLLYYSFFLKFRDVKS